MTRGRPRKDVQTLQLHGTFKPSRHGDRLLAPEAAGEPDKPEGLGPEAQWLWDLVVAELTKNGTVKRIDTAHLWSMCELWGFYRTVAEKAKVFPENKGIRIAVIGYQAAFEAAASKCGLTPIDRQRLHGSKDSEKSTGVAKRSRA